MSIKILTLIAFIGYTLGIILVALIFKIVKYSKEEQIKYNTNRDYTIIE